MKEVVGREALRLPVTPENTRNTEGCFLRLKDGSILHAYSHYGTKGIDDDPSDIGCVRSYDEGETWVDRKILYAHQGEENIMCPSLMRMANGDIGMFHIWRVKTCENGVDGCRIEIRLVRSADEGETWSEPTLCSPKEGYYVFENGHAIRLKSGRIIVPLAYHLPGNDWRGITWYAKMCFMLSDDDGRSWFEASSRPSGPPPEWTMTGMQETMVYETDSGRIRAFARTDLGCQYESYSDDGGITWSDPQPNRAFMSPICAMMMKKAADLTLAVLNPIPAHYDHDLKLVSCRSPLICMVSDDDGKTFPRIYALDHDMNASYPDVFYDGGDSVLITYHASCDGIIRKIKLDDLRK